MVAGSALESGEIGGCREPQPVSTRDQHAGPGGETNSLYCIILRHCARWLAMQARRRARYGKVVRYPADRRSAVVRSGDVIRRKRILPGYGQLVRP